MLNTLRRGFAIAALFAIMGAAALATPQPDFGPNVLIFDSTMTDVQAKVTAVFAKQERAQFGSERYALLFKPGKYTADVRVGFYTSVLGLGNSPDDVEITGAVRSDGQWMGGNATCTFWRAIENLSVNPTQGKGTLMWAISQGTAFRRVHVKGNLNLADNGTSSGGFVADSKIDGRVTSGSQQQYCSRNDDLGSWTGYVWNMVFVGVKNPPPASWPRPPYTIVDKTPVIREKPYLVYDNDRYFVMLPELQKDTNGPDWGKEGGVQIPIDKFYIAKASTDTATTINAAIDAGKDILLTPGLYNLDAPIKVTKPNIVIHGIGYPTLTPTKGTSTIEVADVDGVTLAGMILDAGPTLSPTLLQVGDPGSKADHSANPTFLFDIFARAGGQTAGKADAFVTINSNNVVGDNFWLWRADHGAGVGWGSNVNKNGLIVNGNDVTCYGMFIEHCQEYQLLWNGNGGRLYMYQSELPYDPPADVWKHDGVSGYASYKVADTVTTHEAYGIGVYAVIRTGATPFDVIEAPNVPGVKMTHLVAVKIQGGIRFLFNGATPCNGFDTYSKN